MRNLIVMLVLILFVSSCKKDDDCPNLCVNSIQNDIVLDIHYNKLSSCNSSDPDGSFEIYFKSEEAYFNDTECNRQPIPFPFTFQGIIIAQGVKVPYVGPNGGDPGYSLDVSIKKDTCNRFIDFKFILNTIDTSRILEHNESVIVLLNGVDSTYTVNFTNEIIPFKE